MRARHPRPLDGADVAKRTLNEGNKDAIAAPSLLLSNYYSGEIEAVLRGFRRTSSLVEAAPMLLYGVKTVRSKHYPLGPPITIYGTESRDLTLRQIAGLERAVT